MKKIFAPHLNHHVVLGGRKRPKSYARRPLFSLLTRDAGVALPTPPDSTSYHNPALAILRRMFLNDTRGDCVIAGRGHRIGVLTSNTGKPFAYTDAQILAEYERIGGFDPNNPDATDQGCSMSEAADDGVTHGYADGSKDLAWVDVDATSKLDVMRMVYLFEHGDLGIELPDEWINPFPQEGTVWDVAGPGNPENGHCVQIVDYNSTGVVISTWGILVTMTWAALAKYGSREAYGELIAHLSPDEMVAASQKAPNALDWHTLVTYFNGMGGKAPIPPAPPAPAPQPAPTPAPAPPTPGPTPVFVVTLADAERWAKAGIAKAPKGIVTAALAEKLALEGLAAHWPK